MAKRKRALSKKPVSPPKRRKIVAKKPSAAKSKARKTTPKKTKAKKTTSKKSAKKTKKTKTKTSTTKKSKAKKPTKPVVGRVAAAPGAVMPSAVEKNDALASGAVVAPYDVDMSITDAAKNMDKFYRMQVIEAAEKFYFAMQWGRNGTRGQTQVKGPFDAQEEAVELMEKKFKAKTGNAWADRANAATGTADSSQRKGRGHYEFSARLDEAGAKKSKVAGSVAISLMWDHSSRQRRNDLDLWVTCPSGERIGYYHKKSKCSGQLDVDRMMNAPRPVENIVWTGNAPKGTYKVQVHNYAANHRNPVPFQVGIVLAGGEMEIIEKVIPGADGSWVDVKTFTL